MLKQHKSYQNKSPVIQEHFSFQSENVGFKKSAWEQNPYKYSQWGAERAVDGLYSDLSAAGGQCVISDDYQSTAEWRVDLGRIHIIHHIVIYYRTEHKDSGIYLCFCIF